MMGRKLEEGDWAYVYCGAKEIPLRGWSNLSIDVLHEGLGVEHKMLSRPSAVDILTVCGTRLMHPAATRSIRVTDGDPNEVMRDVLGQYGALVEARRMKVAETSPSSTADLRTGWLLWRVDLVEFLYFEVETEIPDPSAYYAEWHDSGGGGGRKTSRNLWIYEQATGVKRYSVTTAAGAKIQPYFDVPPPDDQNLYYFRSQGELLPTGLIRIWVTHATLRELRRSLGGDLSPEALEGLILRAIDTPDVPIVESGSEGNEAVALLLTSSTYELLKSSFDGVSDEHLMRLALIRLGD
jgi:hypothetical protein